MYCLKCGTFNPDGSRFCESCGSPLSASSPAPSGDETVLLSSQKGVDSSSFDDKTVLLTPKGSTATPPVPPRSEASASGPASSSAPTSPAFQPASVQRTQPGAAPNQNPGNPPKPAKSEKAPKTTKPHKGKKPLVWVLVILLVLAGLGVGGWFGWNAYQDGQYQEQLSLGEKYLKELNYEDAIVALNRAIEIDPRSPEPYLLLADVYIEQEDLDSAKKVLEEGYQATGGNEEIKKRQEEVKQKEEDAAEQKKEQEEQKKLEELAQNAGNLYADYLQNTLVPQYGLAKISVSGTKHAIEDKWFDMSGIMTAKVLDLDNNGMSELLTVRIEAKDTIQTSEMYKDTLDYILYLDVYQLQNDGTVVLSGEQPLEYYTDDPQSQLSFNSINFSDIDLHMNMITVDGKNLLIVEYVTQHFARGTSTYLIGSTLHQWTMVYQNDSFHFVSQLSSVGTGDMKYLGYEFKNDKPVSKEILLSYIGSEKSLYASLESAIFEFWEDHGISAAYRQDEDTFDNTMTGENQITSIMDFLINSSKNGFSSTSLMNAYIVDQADLPALLDH